MLKRKFADCKIKLNKNGDLPEKVKRNTKIRRARVNKRILGRSIDERSPRIESRRNFGHWECDLVLGHKTKDDDVLLNSVRTKDASVPHDQD